MTRENVRITAAGRTDTGVHALGQVAHFDTDSSHTLQRIAMSMNGILPKDISIINAYHVNDDFNARFDAVERKYVYTIYNHPLRSPFMLYRAMWHKDNIDVSYLNEIAGYLTGEHDFASFCKKVSANDVNTVRRINKIKVKRLKNFVNISVKGTAFLHNMIRTIVGTMLTMHKQNLPPVEVLRIIKDADRCSGGFTAPPYGLYLKKIFYNPELPSYPSAF